MLEEFARYGNFHIPQSLNADEGWQIVEAILDSDNEAVQLALSYSLMYMCPDILFGNINSRLALADAPGAFELYMWIVQELDLSKNKSLVPLYENALKSDDPVVVSLTISYLCSVADHVSEDARNAIWDIWKREQNATPVWLAARSFLFPDYRSRAAGPRLGLQRLQRH